MEIEKQMEREEPGSAEPASEPDPTAEKSGGGGGGVVKEIKMEQHAQGVTETLEEPKVLK